MVVIQHNVVFLKTAGLNGKAFIAFVRNKKEWTVVANAQLAFKQRLLVHILMHKPMLKYGYILNLLSAFTLEL